MYGSSKRGFATAVITGGLIGVSGTSAALRSNPPVAPVPPVRSPNPESNSFNTAGQRSASEAAVDRIDSSSGGLGDPGRSVQVDFGQSGPRVNGGRPPFGERPRGDEPRSTGPAGPGSGRFGSTGPGPGGSGFAGSEAAGSAFGGQRGDGPELGGPRYRGSGFDGPASGASGSFGASGGSGASGGDGPAYGRPGSGGSGSGGSDFTGPSMYRATYRTPGEQSPFSAAAPPAGPFNDRNPYSYGSDSPRSGTGANQPDFGTERDLGGESTHQARRDDVRRPLPGDEPIRAAHPGEPADRARDFGSAGRDRSGRLDEPASRSSYRAPESGGAPPSLPSSPVGYSFGATAERPNLDERPSPAELGRHGSGALRAVPGMTGTSESGGRRHAPETPSEPESRATGTGSHRAVAGSGSRRTVAELVSASGAQPMVPTDGPGRRARPDDSPGYGGLRVVPNVDEPKGYPSRSEVPDSVRPAERVERTGTGGFESVARATGTDGFRAVSPPRAADAGMGALGPAEGSLGTGFHAYGGAPEVEPGRGGQRAPRSRMFMDRSIESSLPNAAVVSRQFAADRAASDAYSRTAGHDAPHRGADQSVPARGVEADAPFRGAAQNAPYRGAEPDAQFRRSESDGPFRGAEPSPPYRGADRGPSYRGAEPDAPYRRTELDGPYRGGEQSAPYRGAEPDAQFGRTDLDGPFRGAEQGAPYRMPESDSSYRGPSRESHREDALGRRDQHLAEPRRPGHDSPASSRSDASALGSLDSSGLFGSLGRRPDRDDR